MRRITRAVMVGVGGLLAALPCTAVCNVVAAERGASGALSAGRRDTLVCTGLNGGSPAAMMALLVDPAGNELASHTCEALAFEESCAVLHENPSPIPLVARCVVLRAGSGPFWGSLRLDNTVDSSGVVSAVDKAGAGQIPVGCKGG